MNKKSFNWGPALFLIIYHIILLGYLPFYFYSCTPSVGLITVSIVLYFVTGISITGGYHRYYAHRTYRANTFVEAILLFFATMAIQGSALRWSFDHRLHHAHVDTDEDPYSISKGFWYAHFLWILEKPRAIEQRVVPDLFKNKLVMLQHKHYEWLILATNLLVVLLFGWVFQDYLGALVVGCGLRIFALHHSTWFINSLAHTWGDKPFCQEQSAVNNYILSLLTFGEGYHNYHHTFANDYRNGIRWYHFDPTKWVIWTLAKLGLANSLRSMDALTIKKRMVNERKNLLLEKIKETCHAKKEEMEKAIHEVSERIVEKIARINQLKENYVLIKKEEHRERMEQYRERAAQLRQEIKDLKRSVREDWRLWVQISHNILNIQPAITG